MKRILVLASLVAAHCLIASVAQAESAVRTERAAAQSEHVTVTARDGTVFRGELVEKIPDRHVTVLLPTGKFVELAWADVASIIDTEAMESSSEGSPSVSALTVVSFRAKDSKATLQKLRSNGEWFDVCASPCQGNVSRHGIYRIAGNGIRPSEAFKLPDSHVQIDAVVGRYSQQTVGCVLASAGALVAYVGFLSWSIGVAGGAMGEGGERDENSYGTTGAVLMLGGAAVVVGGILMVKRSKTSVSAQGMRSSSARSSPAIVEPRLAISKSLALTPRGLEF